MKYISKSYKGITLVALVITIIVMLILTGTTISVTIGENGIIASARKAAFMEEMTMVRQNIDEVRIVYQVENNMPSFITDNFSEEVTKDKADEWDKTLIYEIAYFRSIGGILSITEEMNIEKLNEKYAYNYYNNNPEDFLSGIYYINQNLVKSDKEEKYIYDSKIDIAYKVPVTKIGSMKVHSIEYLNKLTNTGEEQLDLPETIEVEGEFREVNGVKYYTPNLKGFEAEKTYMVGYLKTYSEEEQTYKYSTDEAIQIPVKEYIEQGQPNETTKTDANGVEQTYIFYDYKNQVWANVVTKNNDKEAWWVWIPRYMYKINGSESLIEFVDINNQPGQDGTDLTDYVLQPGFTVDGKELQGIWTSKYEPTLALAQQSNLLSYYIPDMSGFNKNITWLQICEETEEGAKIVDEIRLADIQESSLKEFSQNHLWFDYEKQIWANVRTENQETGQESWWVWIPRYAYKIIGNVTDIKFIDIYNNPVDGGDLEGYTVHPAFTVDGQELKGIWVSKYEPTLATQVETIKQNVNKPDLKGFTTTNSYIVGYLKTWSEEEQKYKYSTENAIQMPIGEYINQGEPAQITQNGQTYVFYDYNNQAWANVVTKNNDQEAWWVWIPRYSYSIIQTVTDIIFTKTDNTPTTSGIKIPAYYIPHPAFTVDGQELEGIWISKYEPTGTPSTVE